MKSHFFAIATGATVLLGASSTGWARPPRTHSLSGVVEAIDCPNQTITFKSKDGATPLTFVWNDSTRYSRKGGCAKCSMGAGQTVRVSYARELGQNVLREVRTKGASAGCGSACK